VLKLPRAYVDEMIAHARENAPNECCGIIAGNSGKATKLYRAKNAAESPYRYEVDTRDLVRINNDIQDNNWDFLVIYHSHTGTEAYPSETDRRLAFYPDAYYVLVSLMDENKPVVRAFRIRDGEVIEEELQVA
jgi:proteasome lid subunit RPN8/RPN11